MLRRWRAPCGFFFFFFFFFIVNDLVLPLCDSIVGHPAAVVAVLKLGRLSFGWGRGQAWNIDRRVSCIRVVRCLSDRGPPFACQASAILATYLFSIKLISLSAWRYNQKEPKRAQ